VTYCPPPPSDIEVRFAWVDSRGCTECTVARLRLVVDDKRILASSVMLQDYSDLNSHSSRAIDVTQSGGWDCANHTQDQSATDNRLIGVNFEVCVRLLRKRENDFHVGYVLRIKNPFPSQAYSIVTNVTFRVELLGTNSCRATLLTAQTQYESDPTAWVPLKSLREQACYFVTPG
jgi:hypothetical protein